MSLSVRVLPDEVWKSILRLLPLKDRLNCSSVSQSFYRVAAAATEELRFYFGPNASSDSIPCFWRWIEKRGDRLLKLQLTCSGEEMVGWLPCQHLSVLELYGSRVQLSASSSAPGVLQSCTGLQKLVLQQCKLVGRSSSLKALNNLAKLQHLEVSLTQPADAPQGMPLSSTVLQQLTCLTHLQLDLYDSLVAAEDPPLQHLSFLQQLVQLTLSCQVIFSPSALPGLSRLTALKALELCGGRLAPVALRSCTQLQSLSIRGTRITDPDTGAEVGGEALLSALGHMQQLRLLRLQMVTCTGWPPLGASYAAITASSKLQRLLLQDCGELRGAWHDMCPEGRSLPKLQKLQLYPGGSNLAELPAMSAADLSRLMCCCPGAEDLEIFIAQGVQLGPLAQLSSLTRLFVIGAHVSGSLPGLSAVSGLRSLSVCDSHQTDQQQLFAVTALRQLTALRLTRMGVAFRDGLEFKQKDAKGLPDVWLQIVEHCADNSSLMRQFTCGLGQLLAQQEQQFTARIERLEQQLTQQQQQQAAEATPASGGLQRRLQVLEGQVQQLTQALQEQQAHGA